MLAAATYNGVLQPRMEAFLHDLKAMNLQNRTVAILENGTWAPVSGRHMKAILEGMKNMTVLDASVALKSTLAAGQLDTLAAMADESAAQLAE